MPQHNQTLHHNGVTSCLSRGRAFFTATGSALDWRRQLEMVLLYELGDAALFSAAGRARGHPRDQLAHVV